MGCLITAGITSGCDLATAGINREKIWVFNASEITAYTEAGSTVSALTLEALKTGFKLDIHKNSGVFEETLQGAENSGASYNQSFTCRILTDTDTVRTAINDMKHSDLVFVVKKKNGNFELYGHTDGLRMGDGSLKSTGAKAGDDAGDVLVFLGDSFENKAPFFFDTSEAATEVTLDSYL